MASGIEDAANGPMFRTQLVSLNKEKGRLRITYNWLYSALNCTTDPNTAFYWIISKLNDGQVSLSPADGYEGMTLYASVRDDWDYFVQVQAPNSADWIQAVGGDEVIGFQSSTVPLIVKFTGFQGGVLAVNQTISDHDGTSGYRIQADGSGDLNSQLWLMLDAQSLQPQVRVASAAQASTADIAAALGEFGATRISVSDVQALIS